MQEAVSNAVAQMGDDKTTVLHDDDSAAQKAAKNTNNPLGLMLNYGDDEDDDEDEDDEEEETGGSSAGERRQDATERTAPLPSAQIGDSAQGSEDPLASFLNELNDEGLLDDQEATPGTLFLL